MRTELLEYIQRLALGNYKLSKELPFTAGGDNLYLKNPRTVYVDNPQIALSPIVQALDGFSLYSETTTVSVYFTSDAKQLVQNYDSLVEQLINGKAINPERGFNSRDVSLNSEYVNDLLVTQLDYNFIKIRK